MLLFKSSACLILIGSGGIQKGAFCLQFLVTLRDETEWIETVKSCWNILVGADSQRILQSVEKARPRGQTECRWKKGKASQSVSSWSQGYLAVPASAFQYVSLTFELALPFLQLLTEFLLGLA